MSNAPPPVEFTCPHCGALNGRQHGDCWLCKQSLAEVPERPILAEAVPVAPQFGLSTLLLVITVICICVGLISIAPGLIIPLAVIVVPALIRSVVATNAVGQQTSASSKITTFIVSLALVTLIWVAGIIALGVACTLIVFGGAAFNFSNDVMGVIIVLSIGAVVSVLGLMGWLFYRSLPNHRK